jgi:phosphatidylglycerophosphate synthase
MPSKLTHIAGELRKVPNQLTLLRVAVTIALYWLVDGDRWWFIGVLLFAWATDAADGYLARRLGLTSDFGMRLDSLADYFLIASCLWWLARLCPEVYQTNGATWWTMAVAVAVPQVIAIVKLRRFAGFHLWSAKVTAVLVLVGFVSWFVPGSRHLPLWIVAAAVVLKGIDEVAVCLAVPDAYADRRPSIFHYFPRRREPDKKP